MSALARVCSLSLVCLLWFYGSALHAADEKPLGEKDLVSLIDLQIDDAAIVAKISKGGLAFEADDAVLERLKKSGASDALLKAVRAAASAEKRTAPGHAVTYQDVLKLLSLGIDDEAILKRLDKSPTVFTPSAEQVAELKKAGASDKLLAALQTRRTISAAAAELISDFAIVLDCSGSMKEATKEGESKMAVAQRVVTDLIQQIPDGLNVTLVIYGHEVFGGADDPRNCQAVKVVRPLSKLDASGKSELSSLIAELKPTGSTPIALALRTAGAELAKDKDAFSGVVLITDGLETCKGDPEAEAAALAGNLKLTFGVHVIGFDVTPQESESLKEIAAAGKGKYHNAASAAELTAAVKNLRTQLTSVTREAVADDAPVPELTVLVKPHYGNENPLHSEFIVNGKTVDIFKSESQKSLGKLFVRGWNTITIKTRPQEPANDSNGLTFQIGPVVTDDEGRMLMKPVLWEFQNDTDWVFKEKKFSHPLGPNTKEVELTYRVYYAGLDRESQELTQGDYVLQGTPSYGTNAPVTGTVFVNDTPLNSFVLEKRQVVITSLLKQGRNEIRIVSSRVPNAIADNDINFEVSGPARYNAVDMKFEVSEICQFKTMQSWGRDKRTGQLVNKVKAGAETIERVIPFHLDEDPNSEAARTAEAVPVATPDAPAGSMMVFVHQQYGNENPMFSEFRINGTLVDVFTSNRQRPIGNWLKAGWNTITIKTIPQPPANEFNGLSFDIGPVRYDEEQDKLLMEPVLWSFRNDTDWKLKEGGFAHPLGPVVKEVELSYRVYFAGLEQERVPLKDGDYFLNATASYGNNAPVTGTVFVNGTPLNSFILGRRQVVITPLLKQGNNEISIVSNQVANAIADNDITFQLAGPAEYQSVTMKFEAKPVVEFKTMEGWERNKRTGQLVNKVEAGATEIKRAIPFVLEQAP